MFEMNQRWELGKDRWRPSGEIIRPSEYDVEPMAGKDAKAIAFVERHHYSRSYPSGRFAFGLRRHGRLVGIAVFSHPTNNLTLTNVFPCDKLEATELGRLVLLDEVPGNGESWFVARCFEHLRKGGIKGVLSFSDPVRRHRADGTVVMPGHIGRIYQALNAVYTGRGTARTLRLFPDGTVFNERTTQKIRKRERGWDAAVKGLQARGAGPLEGDSCDWLRFWLPQLTRPLRHAGNHKYVWALDRRLRKNLPDPKPYPKLIDPEAA
jgi:hypothetical protein